MVLKTIQIDSKDEKAGVATGKYAVKQVRTDRLMLPSHLAAPHIDHWREWVAKISAPVAVDLFCGAGGLSLGLEESGYVVILGLDKDSIATETHAHNFRGLTLNRDLSDASVLDDVCGLLDGLEIDLIAGGPPCQPFSRAGRSKIRDLVRSGARSPEDNRRVLWQGFLEVIGRVRPGAVLFENVPDMALLDDLSVVRQIAHTLDGLGYETDFRLLDARQHGVPQFRQRFFLVALREGQPFDWPEPTEAVTLHDAIGDLPPLGNTTGDRAARYRRKPRTALQVRARLGVDNPNVVHDHLTRPVREDDRQAFALMTSTTRYSDLPPELQRYRSDIFDDKYKKLCPRRWTSRPASCLGTSPKPSATSA